MTNLVEVAVRRSGTARVKRASINGVQLVWDGNTSKAKKLPKGNHVFSWYVEGKKGNTYRFWFSKPSGIKCRPGGTLPADGFDSGECPFSL